MTNQTKQIVVLSTKGGAGKTTISSALAVFLHEKGFRVLALDADVDAPNLGIVLRCSEKERIPLIASEKANIFHDKCDLCGICVENCPEKALKIENEKLILNYYLCEGCGICEYVCPSDAIVVKETDSGVLKVGESEYGFPCITGELNIGEGSSGKIVTEARNVTKKIVDEKAIDYVVIDGPPGSSCATMASLTGTDFAVLVTEPTPAAISDLQRAIYLANHFKIPFGIVLNKSDLVTDFNEQVSNFLKNNKDKILGQLPFDSKIPEALANLTPINKYLPPHSEIMEKINEIGLNVLKNVGK